MLQLVDAWITECEQAVASARDRTEHLHYLMMLERARAVRTELLEKAS